MKKKKTKDQIKTREKEGGELSRKGMDPTITNLRDLPSIIHVEITPSPFNFYGVPKLPVMKMGAPRYTYDA